MSDSIAGLRTETCTARKLWPKGVYRTDLTSRRVEYPRSTTTSSGLVYGNHCGDRIGSSATHTNSTILSHAVFLAGQGGIHEHASRAAELIPVPSAKRDAIGGIVHDAMTNYFDNTLANSTGMHAMFRAANLILGPTGDGVGLCSCEYAMLRRAGERLNGMFRGRSEHERWYASWCLEHNPRPRSEQG